MEIDTAELKIHDETNLEKIIFIVDPRDKRVGYEERKNRQSKRVIQFGAEAELSKIKDILVLCDMINTETKDYCWKIDEFLRLLLYNLPADKAFTCLEKLPLSDFSCDIKCYLLDANYKLGNTEKCFNYLDNYEFDEDMLEANFFIYNSFKKGQIDETVRVRFKSCFEADLKTKRYCRGRRTDTLYIFSKDDNDFVNTICRLEENANDNPIKANLWTNLLFNEYCFKPDVLVNMFVESKKIKVLEKIIISRAYKSKNDYELHDYIFRIAAFDEHFLNTIVDRLMDYREEINRDILSGLWKQDNSFDLADIIFDRVVQSQKAPYYIPLFVEQIFIREDFSNQGNRDFLNWAMQKIDRINNKKAIKLLTDLVSKCSGELVAKYYIKLVENRINIDTFKQILCCPTSYSWTGSEVNVCMSKIKRFESILSLMPTDLIYLEYRSLIEDYLKELRNNIKKIRIREKLMFDNN